jgi:hypothetical protein
MGFDVKSDIPLRIPIDLEEGNNNDIFETSIGLDGNPTPLQLTELEKLFEMFH